MYELHSCLKQSLEDYYVFKESLGYKPQSYMYVLKQLDKAACERNYKHKDIITKKFAYEWLEIKPTENENGRRKRALVFNDFSKFLRATGHDSFVLPKGSFGRYVKPMPYIYSDEELTQIFDAVDSNTAKGEWRQLLPVMIRFYFTTGVRPREPVMMLRKDVDLTDGTALIKDSKGHKDRLIAFSKEMNDMLIEYDDRISKLFPEREYFFTVTGSMLSLDSLRKEFNVCYTRSGIELNGRNKPRLYDWRHNYASRAIQMMLEDKMDVDSMMVVLSEYMGHVEFRDTYYYISILPANLIETKKLDWSGLPEVPREE